MVWAKKHQLQNGKYIIEEVLGQGGFGITYKALDTEINQYVVIKTPNEYLKYDPQYDKYVDKFKKEAKRLAKFSTNPHPHIVRTRHFFQEVNSYCLVMDFIDGETLFEMVRRRGRIPEKEAVRYIKQIGKALKIIHRSNLVHRDAHPGNIMVNRDGKAILIDFGIAKELIPTTQSSTGNAGNHGFAPFEQIYKGSREPNVDVYCLSATFYFVLTGQHPTNSVTRKLDNGRLIPPKDLVPSINKKINKAIIKGMALEPKFRPRTMHKWLCLMFKRSKKKPWFSLMLVMISYSIASFILVIYRVDTHVWLIFWAGAGAWAVTWSVLLAGAIAWSGAMTWSGAVAWAGAIAWAGAVAWAVTWAMAWAGAVAWTGTIAWAVTWTMTVAGVFAVAWAVVKLRNELFSSTEILLILSFSSSVGLSLGWLLGKLLLTSQS